MEEDPDVLLREAEEAVAREAMLKSFPTVPKHRPVREERRDVESVFASGVEEARPCSEKKRREFKRNQEYLNDRAFSVAPTFVSEQ